MAHLRVACDDITDVHFSIHDDNTVSLFLIAPMDTNLDGNPMATIKVDRTASIYFTTMNDLWYAKWMSSHHHGIWCGFSDVHGETKCKRAHDTKEEAVQCAIGRYLVFRGAM